MRCVSSVDCGSAGASGSAGDLKIHAQSKLKPLSTVAKLGELGVLAKPAATGSTPAAVYAFAQEAGVEYRVGLHNFYVITRYNRSVMYALAAWQLGQAVGAKNRVSVSVGTDTQNDEPAG